MKKEIRVKDYVDTYVGRYTLDNVEKDIKEAKENGYEDITVNVEGLSINNDYTFLIADIIDFYKCTFIGLGNKEDDIDAIINTGAFLKRDMGTESYVKWFKRMVESADFPLMIRDNRLKKAVNTEMNVLQPVMFDDKNFYYNVIRPQYLEPIDLERAMKNEQSVFTMETIRIVDIAKYEEGFRLASTENERYILDIFESILTENFLGIA